MYVDILGGRSAPAVGWYLQAIGRKGARNSLYLVLSARRVKRRDPKALPRIAMEIEQINEIPPSARATAKIFEFRWYPRKKKRKTFEQELSDGIRRRADGRQEQDRMD